MAKFVAKIMGLVERLEMILLSASIAIIVLQVVFRYILQAPLSWTEQAARHLFVWMIMLGVPVAFHRKNLMAFDLLLHSLPAGLQTLARGGIMLVEICFCAFFCYSSVALCLRTGWRPAPGIQIPIALLYFSMTAAMVLTLLVLADQALSRAQERKEA